MAGWLPLWFLRTHSPSAESWVVTGDQMTPPVAIYHNREKWVLSSRNKLYQLWESWPLLWLDKDGGVTPTANSLVFQGLRTLLRLDWCLGLTSGPSEALGLPLGQKYLECLCVELIYRISDGLPVTTAECNGEVFLFQCRSLHTICLAGQHVDTFPASLSTGAFVPGKGIKTSSLSFKPLWREAPPHIWLLWLSLSYVLGLKAPCIRTFMWEKATRRWVHAHLPRLYLVPQLLLLLKTSCFSGIFDSWRW